MNLEHLLELAKESAMGAYSPYSKFRVGAALLCSDGTIFTGVNIENRSFGLTNCAERTAIFKAISEGHRSFDAIAVYGPDADAPLSPCGACRQVLSEFCHKDFIVIFAGGDSEAVTVTLNELIPHDTLHNLKER